MKTERRRMMIFLGIMVVFMTICCVCTKLNAQSINLRIGDSQAKGCVGAEFQYENFSISGGWRPMLLKYPNRWEHSFSGAMTFFSTERGNAVYLTAAVSSEGMLYQGKTRFETEPSVMVLAGLRYYPNRDIPYISKKISFDWGIGINMAQDVVQFSMEFIVNFNVFK
jgi:hypothetical protein